MFTFYKVEQRHLEVNLSDYFFVDINASQKKIFNKS